MPELHIMQCISEAYCFVGRRVDRLVSSVLRDGIYQYQFQSLRDVIELN